MAPANMFMVYAFVLRILIESLDLVRTLGGFGLRVAFDDDLHEHRA